ncbi:unnamed protein product [Fraxinus pennsylvanica]|uniref:Uncharacterized protein n=1 Tax=Fraxinus pennsylvanica TaxID=56036 RepID=A0AAD1ZGW1_9LAMI|nr:unnamed protein product [Fraxinus pennsylvanica]
MYTIYDSNHNKEFQTTRRLFDQPEIWERQNRMESGNAFRKLNENMSLHTKLSSVQEPTRSLKQDQAIACGPSHCISMLGEPTILLAQTANPQLLRLKAYWTSFVIPNAGLPVNNL